MLWRRERRGGPQHPDIMMEDAGSALEKNVADLTVMDVYDMAAVVGQEFERIIDQYGCEALSRLMPKVVRVLEILEVMVSRGSMSPETEELRLELDRLRMERLERLEKEKRHRQVRTHLNATRARTSPPPAGEVKGGTLWS